MLKVDMFRSKLNKVSISNKNKVSPLVHLDDMYAAFDAAFPDLVYGSQEEPVIGEEKTGENGRIIFINFWRRRYLLYRTIKSD